MPNTPGFDTAAMAAAITAAQESGGPIIDAAPSIPDAGAPPGFDTSALLSGDPNGTVQIAGEGAGGVALSAPPPQPAQQPTLPEPAPDVAPDPSDPALHQQGRQMGTPQPAAPTDDGPTMEPFDPYLGDPNQPTAPAPQPEPAAPVLPDPATDGAVDTDTGHFDPSRVYELVLGHAPTADEVVQTVSLASRFASLTPEQQQWVDGIMGGRIDPRQIEAQLQAAQQAQQPAPQRARDPYDDPYTEPPAPDPALEAERQALAREREALQQQQAQWEQQTVAHAQAEAQRALVEFRSAHADWAPEELAALEARVNQSAVWGGIYSSTGDAYSATAQTIQLEALNHPHFREKLMGSAATSPEPTADDVARATAAAALAGNGSGGGARPTGPSTPPSPTDPRLSQVAAPPGYTGIPAQQPVQPVHSALTTPQQTAGPDLNNRNEVALAMAAQIAQMVGDR